MQTTAAEALAAMARALGTLEVPWYLFGAQAAIHWGRPRLSADIDLTVWLEPKAVGTLLTALREEGFHSLVEDPDEFTKRTRVLPVEHRATQMPVDLVFAGSALEKQFLERALPVAIGGETIPVISAEDLVVTKVLAGRPKDLDDARGILAVRGDSLDLGLVRSLLELLERTLDRSELVRELERMIGGSSTP